MISVLSSVVGFHQPTYAVYSATKAGVEALTRSFVKKMRGVPDSVNE